jgi:hypothetical protein
MHHFLSLCVCGWIASFPAEIIVGLAIIVLSYPADAILTRPSLLVVEMLYNTGPLAAAVALSPRASELLKNLYIFNILL